MKLINEEIINLFEQGIRKYELIYDHQEVNIYANYYRYISQEEKQILIEYQKSLECILYSKYYWYTKFMKAYISYYGEDSGIRQQQFKILEEIDQRLKNQVDWTIIEEIEST